MVKMRRKTTTLIAIVIVVALTGYSLFSVFGPSHTLAQSNYLTRGVAYGQVKFTNGAMSSTYNLSAGAPDGPTGSSSVFAVTLSIKKTGQDLSGPYTNSSFYINNATLRFPDGTSSTSFQVSQNQTLVEIVFNTQTYSGSGNITMQMYVSFTPTWNVWIYPVPSHEQTVTIGIPLEVT